VFVIDGELRAGSETLATNHLGLLCNRLVRLTATTATRAMVLGGPPLPPRFIEWNFVSSSRHKIAAARDAWKARQFPIIPTDPDEFIPWPSP
jgi:redox-sensitive bicupin YhaK (pirin superfamily)